MTEPTHLLLPVILVNKVLAYLAQRPYAEVHELIGEVKVVGEASIAAQKAQAVTGAGREQSTS